MRKKLISITIITLASFILAGGFLFFVISPVSAYEVADFSPSGTIAGNYIKVGDNWVLKSTLSGRLESIKNWTTTFTNRIDDLLGDKAAAMAFKSGLSNFLNRMAYDTATYLATGDKGQAPMFQTDNLGDFLKNAADYAAGDFLEAFGKSGVLGAKFNVCEPDPRVKFKIGFGLYRQYRPAEPDCTFSEMKNNWDEALNDPNFLNNFQAVFDPRQNDLGIALTLQTGMEEYISQKVQAERDEYIKSDGWKNVTESISGAIKTPSDLVIRRAEKVIDETTGQEKVFTGNILADAINIFVNTLAGKLMDKWFGQGLVLKFPSGGYDWSGISDYYSGGYQEGIKGAKDRFLSISETNFKVRGDYEVLGELTSCPNPEKAGPTNCVITEKFRQAVSERMTVGEAMEKGFLNPEGLFGFRSDGLEPNYNEGYPYRSMLILRKFRIIPIGWELAAQQIEKNSEQGPRNLRDMVNCFDPNDKYTGFNDNGSQSWCQGLVDPTWVLKAPLNFCKKEGPGPEIVSRTVVGRDAESELAISRNTNYCADEQACIKEGKDGSCEIFGYCTKEKRKWDFGGESCDENFNTCDTFKSREGKTVSYLENTLDYIGCNADNAGCTEYCRAYDHLTEKYSCGVASGDKIYLDAGAANCAKNNEGCHEFIRLKEGEGANLLVNSSFEADGTPARVTGGFHGQWSKQSGNETFSPAFNPVSGLSFKGMAITFSLYLKGCGDSITIAVASAPGQETTKTINSGNDWQRFSVTHNSLLATDNSISGRLSGGLASCLIDAVKIEFGGKATPYGDYRENGLIYEKIIPKYLEQACYVNASGGNYNLKNDYAPECLDFARKCNAEEVGCDLYTSVKDRMSVAGKAFAEDYCPSECVGYNEYFQMETAFDSQQPQYFVPASAKKCSSAAAGCDEFTNLDKLGSGAEAREYYSELKQCRKPDESCREFYTWEGSGDTGYQLRVYQMEADNLSGIPNFGPKQTRNVSGECNESIFKKPATDPDYNPDCREFYNKNGYITYRLYSLTIVCSENCHPYRRSENNVVASIGEANSLCAAECAGDTICVSQCGSRVAALSDGGAVFCQNGGVWNSQHGRCLYNAIPDEGKKCSSTQAGCREYSGSSGANMRFIVNDDIEGGTNAGWSGDLPAEFNPSNESLIVGGKSLFVSGGSNLIYKTLGSILNKDRSYYLSFIAKGSGGFNNIGFGSNASVSIPFEIGGDNTLGGDWKIYRFNLASLNNSAGDYVIGNEEKLFIGASGNFYIDNIRLVEIVDRYFLIKNSWNPGACLYDVTGNPEDKYYNIGCEAYRDKENQLHNLRQFNMLCQDSAVGCDLVVDTHNSTRFEQYISATNPMVAVPQDSFAFVVYDKNKSCNSADKGCERLGDPYFYENQVIYRDVYLKNDPDKYDDILCDVAASGCEAWQKSEGSVYFKDPGDHVCERKTPHGQTAVNWLKKEVKKCDTSNNGQIEIGENQICLTDSDCGQEINCLSDKNSYLCQIENKTIGTGGAAGAVFQPHIDAGGRYWAGLCPAGEAGCTEYIDPLSRFSANLVFNPDFKDIDVNGTSGDGWSGSNQQISLEPNTPYVLRVDGGSGGAAISAAGLKYLNSANQIVSGASFSVGNGSVGLFISENAVYATVSGGAVGKTVEIKKAAVDYQIKSKTDKTSCNGLVNFEEGCVLFNERSFGAGGYNSLIWDANRTYEDADGVSPQSGSSNNSQVLLKVNPDRGCETWLTCRSYVKDENNNNVCYNIGLCDKFDEKGNCANIVETETFNNTAYSGEKFTDHSGYFKAGYLFNPYDGAKWIDHNKERNDYFSFERMKQVGEVAKIPNGDFELYGSNGFPIGWQPIEGPWVYDRFKVISSPWEAEREGIAYPVNGKAFLKFSPQRGNAISDFIDVEPGATYVLSAMMNTMNFSVDSADSNDLPAVIVYVRAYDREGRYITRSSDSAVDDHGYEYCLHQVLGYGCGVYLSQRTDWTPLKMQFSLTDSVAKIRIELQGNVWFWDNASAAWPSVSTCSGNPSCVGSAYIDNIQINPALQTYKSNYDIPPNSLTPPIDVKINWIADRWQVGWLQERTCRLYPEDDSLSCEYINDSGVKRKGLHGYCLEYDRYPGNEDACLLWYPIDKVKSDGIEEGAGYIGKYPVYYCIDHSFDAGDFYELPGYTFYFGIDSDGAHGYDNWFYLNDDVYNELIGSKEAEVLCGKAFDDSDFNPQSNFEKYLRIWEEVAGVNSGSFNVRYRKVKDTSEHNQCSKDHPQFDAGMTDPTAHVYQVHLTNSTYCTKIIQTVTPFGQNKFWSGKVYEGSDHSFACNIGLYQPQRCNYLSDGVPFGSVVPPGPTWNILSNPYEWKNILIYRYPESNLSRMGQLHNEENIKRIFAQSYGSWTWANGYSCADGTIPKGGGLTCAQECVDDECVSQGGPYAALANNQSLICNCGSNYTGDYKIACETYQRLALRCGESGGINWWGEDPTLNQRDWDAVEVDFMTAYRKHCGEAGVTISTNCSDNPAQCDACNSAMLCESGDQYVRNTPDCVKPDQSFCAKSGAPCNISLNDCPGSDCVPGGFYAKDDGNLWNPPVEDCNGPRPEDAYCFIRPQVKNVEFNKYAVNSGDFVNLTFNSIVDSQQLPLVMYSVDWGDGDKTVVSGVEMRDRPNESDPHSLYHLYSYWELKKSGLVVCNDEYCEVTAKIQIRDNWGINSGIVVSKAINVYRNALGEMSLPPCNPRTCGLNECGTFDDGCGGTIPCTCPSDSHCDVSTKQCVANCVAQNCDQIGRSCGSGFDGCYSSIFCGNCPTGYTCSALGQCIPDCVNECNLLNQKQCLGTTVVQTCNNYDLDPCLEWGGDVDCSSQCKICQNGSCVASACTASYFGEFNWDTPCPPVSQSFADLYSFCVVGTQRYVGHTCSGGYLYVNCEEDGYMNFNFEKNTCLCQGAGTNYWDGYSYWKGALSCTPSCVNGIYIDANCKSTVCAYGCAPSTGTCSVRYNAYVEGIATQPLICSCGSLVSENLSLYTTDDLRTACINYQNFIGRCGERGGINNWAENIKRDRDNETNTYLSNFWNAYLLNCSQKGVTVVGECSIQAQCDACNAAWVCNNQGYSNYTYGTNTNYCYSR